ncbi:hypothetical protein [Streptomyces tailanensis]|uniref:hypothetical protein n=1 Tax=Streptomyces tailanensis TaxID=2569858 RepID=UPI00155AC13D
MKRNPTSAVNGAGAIVSVWIDRPSGVAAGREPRQLVRAWRVGAGKRAGQGGDLGGEPAGFRDSVETENGQ